MRVLADKTLPGITTLFDSSFQVTLYATSAEAKTLICEQDVLLCRSTLKVSASLLSNSSVRCVATASSGTDHIDCNYLADNNITLIDAKGCNARAVVDYVIACIAYLSNVNKIVGMTVGVVGLGEVGSRLLPRLLALGFNVKCFDPLLAKTCANFIGCEIEDLFSCDLICIHANLHEDKPFPSKNLFNQNLIKHLKDGVVIINAARGGIVNEDDLLSTTKSITYCTDVYCNEPAINAKIIDFATLCTPHIAGHSIEAKKAAVSQVCEAIYNYFGVRLANSSCETQNILSGFEASYLQNERSNKLFMQTGWQNEILELYNPYNETHYFKSTKDKQEAFTRQRQAHKNRHDFNTYSLKLSDERMKLIFGL
jgi:erythronate-4-phosphate dehydrogenase